MFELRNSGENRRKLSEIFFSKIYQGHIRIWFRSKKKLKISHACVPLIVNMAIVMHTKIENSTDERLQVDWQWPAQSTHRVAMASFRHTFHNDGKISPDWWGWGCTPTHISLYLPLRTKLQSTLQLRGRFTRPFSSLPLYVLCDGHSLAYIPWWW